MKIAYPRDNSVATRFYDRYTVRDMVRIGTPALLGWALVGPIGLSAVVIGVALAEFTPRGQTLDRHVVDAAKYQVGLAVGQWPTPITYTSQGAVADNGVVFGLVKVSSVDLAMLSDPETAANLETVNDLFKSLTYPVKLVSRQRHADVTDHAGVDSPVRVTDHFVTVPVFPDEEESQYERFTLVSERCDEVETALTAGDMHAEQVTGDAFQTVAKELTAQPDDVARTSYRTENEHRRVLAIDTYPTEVPAGWLAKVLNVDAPGCVDVVQTVTPIEDTDRDRLQHVLSKAVAERLASDNPVRERELGQLESDIRDLVDVEMEGEPLLHYGVYLVARADSKDDLETTVAQVSAALGQITHRTPLFKMNHAARTLAPMFKDRLGQTRIVPGTTAAAGFPWAASDTVDGDGVVFGEENDGTPIILDRFAWEAGHIARMGKIGSGKSFAAKLEVLRSAERYDNLQVILIDPKQEYRAIAHEVGGTVRHWQPDDRTKDYTAELIDAVRRAYRHGHDHDGKTIVVVDEAHRLLNDGDGRQVLGELVREGRDQEIAVTMVTQNASDFTQSQEGRNILRNVNCYVFMRHSDVDVAVEDFFDLSETEAVRLRKLRTGTDVGFSEAIIRGPVHATIRVEATADEAELLQVRREEESEDRSDPPATTRATATKSGGQTPPDDDGDADPDSSDKLVLEDDPVLTVLLLATGVSSVPLLGILLLPAFTLGRYLKILLLLPVTIGSVMVVVGLLYSLHDANGDDRA